MKASIPAYIQDQLSITNDCVACLKSDERCTDCQEEADTALTVRAYELVDERLAASEKHPWLVHTESSGHDWIGSVVRIPSPDGLSSHERHEYVPPIVNMEDRYFEPELDMSAREIVCSSCHLVCWAELPCPNCQEVNL